MHTSRNSQNNDIAKPNSTSRNAYSDQEKIQQENVADAIRQARLSSNSLTPNDTSILQRTLGNQATGKLIQQVRNVSSDTDSEQSHEFPNLNGFTSQSSTRVPTTVNSETQKSGKCIPISERTLMESRFGHDFNSVRIHRGTSSVSKNRSSEAYTSGENIYLGQHTHSDSKPLDRELLAHELAHVVQQRSTGRSAPLEQLESEADQAGADVMQGKSVRVRLSASPSSVYHRLTPEQIVQQIRDDAGSLPRRLSRGDARRLLEAQGQDSVTELIRQVNDARREHAEKAYRNLVEHYQRAAYHSAIGQWAREQQRRLHRGRRRQDPPSPQHEQLIELEKQSKSEMTSERARRNELFAEARDALIELKSHSVRFTFAHEDLVDRLASLAEGSVNRARRERIYSYNLNEIVSMEDTINTYNQVNDEIRNSPEERNKIEDNFHIALNEQISAQTELRMRRASLYQERRQLERSVGGPGKMRRHLREFPEEPELVAGPPTLEEQSANRYRQIQSELAILSEQQRSIRKHIQAARQVRRDNLRLLRIRQRELRVQQTEIERVSGGRPHIRKLSHQVANSNEIREERKERLRALALERDTNLESALSQTPHQGYDSSILNSEDARWQVFWQAKQNVESGFPGFSQELQSQLILSWQSEIKIDRRNMGFDVSSVGTYHSHGPGQYDVNASAGQPIPVIARDTLDLTRYLGEQNGRIRLFARTSSQVVRVNRGTESDDVLAKLTYGLFGRGVSSAQAIAYMRARASGEAKRPGGADGARLMAGLLFKNASEDNAELPAEITDTRRNIQTLIENRIRERLQLAYGLELPGDQPIFDTVDASQGQFGRPSMIHDGTFENETNPRTGRQYTRREIVALSGRIFGEVGQIVNNDPNVSSAIESLIQTLIERRPDANDKNQNISIRSGPAVTIDHAYREIGEDIENPAQAIVRVSYRHMRQIGKQITVGQLLELDEEIRIGHVGSTGNAISPHVHMSLDLMIDGDTIGWINPIDFFPASGPLDTSR